jgi:hypothetical protein
LQKDVWFSELVTDDTTSHVYRKTMLEFTFCCSVWIVISLLIERFYYGSNIHILVIVGFSGRPLLCGVGLGKQGGKVWTECIWLWIGTGVGLL